MSSNSEAPGGGPFVPHEPFEQYRQRFSELFAMKRENGIIEVRAHFNGGPAQWIYGMHKGWGQVFRTVGDDPENEVLIITGTGDTFIQEMSPEFLKYVAQTLSTNPGEWMRKSYDMQYRDGSALLNNLMYDVHIPTIGVINGSGPGHTEFALTCDLTLCAEDVVFRDPHFSNNVVPGDGQFLIFQKLLGDKRANYMAYTGETIDAQSALQLGLVNEVLPREKLLPRAWEIAEQIMQKDRYVRRLTHDLMRQSMRRHYEDFNLHFAMETWGQCLTMLNRDIDLTAGWKQTNADVAQETAQVAPAGRA